METLIKKEQFDFVSEENKRFIVDFTKQMNWWKTNWKVRRGRIWISWPKIWIYKRLYGSFRGILRKKSIQK